MTHASRHRSGLIIMVAKVTDHARTPERQRSNSRGIDSGLQAENAKMRRHANPSIAILFGLHDCCDDLEISRCIRRACPSRTQKHHFLLSCCNARHFHFVIIMLAALLLNHLQQQCSCCHASPFSDCNNLTIFLANYASILSIIWLVLTMSLYFSTLFLGVRWRENEGIIWPECDEVTLHVQSVLTYKHIQYA